MSTATNGPGVWPCLAYRDADAARAFLTEILGFAETVTVRDDDGEQVVHAELRWPEGGGVMYGSADDATNDAEDAHAAAPRPGTEWLYVRTADPDAVHRQAVAGGARVVREPYDADYGSRNVSIADPEGNIWTFGTYAGAPLPE